MLKLPLFKSLKREMEENQDKKTIKDKIPKTVYTLK